jgi:hypothetical protein
MAPVHRMMVAFEIGALSLQDLKDVEVARLRLEIATRTYPCGRCHDGNDGKALGERVWAYCVGGAPCPHCGAPSPARAALGRFAP